MSAMICCDRKACDSRVQEEQPKPGWILVEPSFDTVRTVATSSAGPWHFCSWDHLNEWLQDRLPAYMPLKKKRVNGD
jgi:hypothetical protein